MLKFHHGAKKPYIKNLYPQSTNAVFGGDLPFARRKGQELARFFLEKALPRKWECAHNDLKNKGNL
jgi:hypothetical protein